MFLVRLIYTSSKCEGFEAGDIEQILTTARQKNAAHSVTGMLCFSKSHFLQCLEGSRQAVNETYNRILGDSRHRDLVILDYSEISARSFQDWSMGYVPDSSLTRGVIVRHSSSCDFDPASMSAASAYEMLLSASQVVPAA
jgi:hypothetical protein